MDDTIKFGFLFFEFFIPYTCAFWMLFGGKENAEKAGDTAWVKVNDIIFSIYQMTLIESINWNLMYKMDRFMAQVCFSILFQFSFNFHCISTIFSIS